ncbi:hypothetical protein [Nonomuraea sp. NPDC049400]|uniref:hypothetical protein n=1 Tax=Nonomuraea sp. NPDC049400 TaxID=3364352 RepID=UPI00379C506C
MGTRAWPRCIARTTAGAAGAVPTNEGGGLRESARPGDVARRTTGAAQYADKAGRPGEGYGG